MRELSGKSWEGRLARILARGAYVLRQMAMRMAKTRITLVTKARVRRLRIYGALARQLHMRHQFARPFLTRGPRPISHCSTFHACIKPVVLPTLPRGLVRHHSSALISTHQHSSALISTYQHPPAPTSTHQHASAPITPQHPSAPLSTPQHPSAPIRTWRTPAGAFPRRL